MDRERAGGASAGETGIQWHNGFYGAFQREFRKNRGDLEFQKELQLTIGALFVDTVVVKLLRDSVLENEIGHSFRTYNICEYKSQDDALSIDDFYKVLGYACLYKSMGQTVNAIPAEEITVAFFRHSYPRELVRALEAAGLRVEERYPGIYYVENRENLDTRLPFPTELVVTGQLDREKHSGLRILARGAEEEDVRRFLLEALGETEQGDRANIDAILQVSVSANLALYEQIRRNDTMCQALRELMKDEIARDVADGVERGIRQGIRQGREQGIRQGREQGIRALVDTYRTELGLDDQAIISRISSRFQLSPEQARAYVLPGGTAEAFR